MHLLSKPSSLMYVILLLTLGSSVSAHAKDPQDLCTLNKYSPQLELTLKGGNTRGIGRLGGVIPIAESNRGLLFANIFGLLDTNQAQEGNLGIGYRHLYDSHILGGYAFFDQRKSELNNTFNQITLGGEYLRDNFELRANVYLPLGKKERVISENKQERSIPNLNYIKVKSDLGSYEQVLSGFDVEVGGNLPSFKPLEGFISYYNFNGNGLKPVHGIRLRSSLKLNEYISLEGEISHDRLREQQTGKKVVVFGGIKLNYTFGKKETKLTGLERKMTQMIVRDIDAITETYSKGSSRVEVELKDEYKALGLEKGATREEKNKAYKKAVLRNHPDKGGSEKVLHRVKEASEILDCLYDGDIEKLVRTKESSENFRTQANVPQDISYGDNYDRTTLKEISEESQDAGKDEIIELSGPKMVEEQDNKQLAIRQNSVPEVAIQEPQAMKGAYVDNFFVVDSNVRKEIQGIIVQDIHHVWLVPKGLDLSSVLGMEREDHGFLDFTAIHDQLIRVNTYDLKGINPNLRKKHLATFTEQSKWEVKKYIGKTEYKVMALGLRARGGMPPSGKREEGVELANILDKRIYDQTKSKTYNEKDLIKHLKAQKQTLIEDWVKKKTNQLIRDMFVLSNSPGINWLVGGAKINLADKKIYEWCSYIVDSIIKICFSTKSTSDSTSDSSADNPTIHEGFLTKKNVEGLKAVGRLGVRVRKIYLFAKLIRDFFSSDSSSSSSNSHENKDSKEGRFAEEFFAQKRREQQRDLESQVESWFSPDETYEQELTALKQELEERRRIERGLVDDIDAEPELVRKLEEKYIVKKPWIPKPWHTRIEDMLIACREKHPFFAEDKEFSMNFVDKALKLPNSHKRLDLDKAMEAFEAEESFSLYNYEERKRLKTIVKRLCQNSNMESGHGKDLAVRALFYGLPGSGKTEAVKKIAKILGIPCINITIGDKKHVFEDCDGSRSHGKKKIGFIAEAFLEEIEGKRYTNAILVFDDIHTVIFDKDSDNPDNDMMTFFLELLDQIKTKRKNKYFDTELLIERLNIVFTANKPVGEGNAKAVSFEAFGSRAPTKVHFEGFSKEKISGHVTEFMQHCLEENKLTDKLSKKDIERIVSDLLPDKNIDLRKVKSKLQDLVANLADDALKGEPKEIKEMPGKREERRENTRMAAEARRERMAERVTKENVKLKELERELE